VALADDIRLLGLRMPEPVIRALAEEFVKDSGHRLTFVFGSPAEVMDKIKANEIHDVVIVAEAAMDQLDKEGLVNPESRVRLAKSGGMAGEVYEAALLSDGAAVQASRALIDFLAGAEARPKWAAAGMEPLGDR
jgi:ABC-type molybdate transport system substrate-binding protein